MSVYTYQCETCERMKVASNYSPEMRMGKKRLMCKTCVKIKTTVFDIECIKCLKKKKNNQFTLAALTKREEKICHECKRKTRKIASILKNEIKYKPVKTICYKQEILDRISELQREKKEHLELIETQKSTMIKRETKRHLECIDSNIQAAKDLMKYL